MADKTAGSCLIVAGRSRRDADGYGQYVEWREMNLSVVQTRGRDGMEAPAVKVEVFFGMGLPGLSLVGMPDASVREARERVKAALLSSQFDFPNRKIIINLSPAELPKEGGGFDLAIALGILAANADVPLQALRQTEFIGELALTGGLASVRGVLPAVIAALRDGHKVVIPAADAQVVAGISGEVRCARTLSEVVAYARGRLTLPLASEVAKDGVAEEPFVGDYSEVCGQADARNLVQIAAAGQHHGVIYGPPGCGKTMLVERMPSIMPPLTAQESMEVQIIASVANQVLHDTTLRPFRSPHHSSSAAALVGGGLNMGIGEITLAHNGILFLDELSQWSRTVLDHLRQPMQSGEVNVARVKRSIIYPARFQLMAASNLCPCGAKGVPGLLCRCNENMMGLFRRKLSAALMDRVDLQAIVRPLNLQELKESGSAESSASIRARVQHARKKQLDRAGKVNSLLNEREYRTTAKLSAKGRAFFQEHASALNFSARGGIRALRVARTIADLEDSETVEVPHVHQAVHYRKNALAQMS